jgi:hypothetical protein
MINTGINPIREIPVVSIIHLLSFTEAENWTDQICRTGDSELRSEEMPHLAAPSQR